MKNNWLSDEPLLADVFGDPILHLVLMRDGLSAEAVRREMVAVGARLAIVRRAMATRAISSEVENAHCKTESAS